MAALPASDSLPADPSHSLKRAAVNDLRTGTQQGAASPKKSRWGEMPDARREALLRSSGWPMDVLQDRAKQPKVVGSAEDFVRELYYGNHLDEIVVLKNGVQLLQQADAVPQAIRTAGHSATTVREFLGALGDEMLGTHNGRIYYADDTGRFLDQLRKDPDTEAELSNLREKLAAINKVEAAGDASMYIAELRRTTKFRHPSDNHWAKTALTTDVKDYVGVERADLMPYWDRYDEGVFVGAAGAGSAMHVDQIGWSNIGKNYTGHKLVALWPYGAASNTALNSHLDHLFASPSGLAAQDQAMLRTACKVALVEPGDVFLFSGAQAHATVCVGEGLCLGAYESFISLAPRHAEVFLNTNDPSFHFKECHAEEEDLRDIQLDLADQLVIAMDEQLPKLESAKSGSGSGADQQGKGDASNSGGDGGSGGSGGPSLPPASGTPSTPPPSTSSSSPSLRVGPESLEAASMLRNAIKVYRSNPTLAKEIPEPPPPPQQPQPLP